MNACALGPYEMSGHAAAGLQQQSTDDLADQSRKAFCVARVLALPLSYQCSPDANEWTSVCF